VEHQLLSYLASKQKVVEPESTSTSVDVSHEEVMEMKLHKAHSMKTVDHVMLEGNIDISSYDIMESVGIELLIHLYCSPHANFKNSIIEEKYSKIGFNPLTCYKLLFMMTKWRKTIECNSSNHLVTSDIINDSTSSVSTMTPTSL
jgi:hypothetical protein